MCLRACGGISFGCVVDIEVSRSALGQFPPLAEAPLLPLKTDSLVSGLCLKRRATPKFDAVADALVFGCWFQCDAVEALMN